MELTAEIDVASPAAAAWSLIGERFGDIGEWAAPILASHLDGQPAVGAVRACRIGGFGPIPGGVVEERLIAFDGRGMSFAYQAASGLPKFVRRAANRWTVTARADGSCRVSMQATLELGGIMRLFGWFLAWKMQRDGQRVLEELRHRLERGVPHPRKLAAMKLLK